MSAEIVNLRRARKSKARAGKQAEAAANRIKFGRSKAERTREAANAELHRRRLDSHRRDEPGDPDP